MGGRVEDVDQVDDARVGGAHGHQGDLVQDLGGAVGTIAQLAGIFGRILDARDAVPALAHRRKQPTASTKQTKTRHQSKTSTGNGSERTTFHQGQKRG